jgi:hypothetical protein
MSNRADLLVVCLVILTALAELALSQTAKTIRLPSGIEVYDLSGEWDALIESYDQTVSFGTNLHVVKIILTGSFCPITGQITSPVMLIGVMLQGDLLLRESFQNGRVLFRGELEENEFAKLEMITDDGKAFLGKGQISENGNKIEIDAPNHGRMTLTRK